MMIFYESVLPHEQVVGFVRSIFMTDAKGTMQISS